MNKTVYLLGLCLVLGVATAQMSGGMSGGMSEGGMSGGMSGGMTGGMSGGGMMDMSLEVMLSGDQEVPAVMTEAMGSATVTLSGDTLTVTGEFSGLSSPQVGAHVHMAAAGEMGDVLLPLNISADADGMSGVFSLSGTLTPEGVEAFHAGELYLNIHSEMNAGGEIRGQIVPSM